MVAHAAVDGVPAACRSSAAPAAKRRSSRWRSPSRPCDDRPLALDFSCAVARSGSALTNGGPIEPSVLAVRNGQLNREGTTMRHLHRLLPAALAGLSLSVFTANTASAAPLCSDGPRIGHTGARHHHRLQSGQPVGYLAQRHEPLLDLGSGDKSNQPLVGDRLYDCDQADGR